MWRMRPVVSEFETMLSGCNDSVDGCVKKDAAMMVDQRTSPDDDTWREMDPLAAEVRKLSCNDSPVFRVDGKEGTGDLFDDETHVCDDRSMMQFDQPELIVCYQETPVQGEDNQFGCALDQQLYGDWQCEELVESDGLLVSLLDNVRADEPRSREESSGEILCQAKQKSPLESLDKGAAGDHVLAEPKESNFADTILPVQEFGTRSFLRSFLNTIDDEDSKASHPPVDLQISSRNGVANSLVEHYNSEVESGSITFNFSPPVSMEDAAANGRTENAKDKSSDSDHGDDLSDTRQAQCRNTGMVNSITSNIEASDEHRHSISEVKYDTGEVNFSATSFVAYSGPIPFSGSLSDGSTTSGRSFAFPMLQSGWHSSPVRMARPDGRHFRKHKCWRSGLLCCRF